MRNFFLCISVFTAALVLSDCTNKDSKNDDSKIFVEIPDPNFKAYLLEKFDANQDGKISLEEAKAVIEIDCSNRNIADLTGIEKFENLETLNCNNNRLEELDVRYNKKINRLVCTNNDADLLTIYFAKSSPLSNKNYVQPAVNSEPGSANFGNPVDVNKCIYDSGKTKLVILFNL